MLQPIFLPFVYLSLNNIEINEHTKICSFDTENMYTNIPTEELKEIITNILNNDQYTNKK
jgi:hypothetical protein